MSLHTFESYNSIIQTTTTVKRWDEFTYFIQILFFLTKVLGYIYIYILAIEIIPKWDRKLITIIRVVSNSGLYGGRISPMTFKCTIDG